MAQAYPITVFLIGTFTISFAAFSLMHIVSGAQSPEGFPGLPVWLIAIWSPSAMAMYLAYENGKLGELLQRLIAFKQLGLSWIIILVPALILCTAIILNWQKADFQEFTPGLIVILIGLNLFLGPLGEEMGWRGFLQPHLESRFGWLLATLIVSSIWAIWHAPLWTIASPQSEIPFYIFFVHVMAYGIMIASAQSIAGQSLVPAVLLHLLFNVTASVALLSGIADTERWYITTAFPYLACSIVIAILIRGMQDGQLHHGVNSTGVF